MYFYQFFYTTEHGRREYNRSESDINNNVSDKDIQMESTLEVNKLGLLTTKVD
jgi:hypothetical protein